jgi:hypothetical protein
VNHDWTVATEHTVHPVGMHNYAFPSPEAARRFAVEAVRAPGVVRAEVRNDGVLVDEITEHTKQTHEWVPNQKMGFRLERRD